MSIPKEDWKRIKMCLDRAASMAADGWRASRLGWDFPGGAEEEHIDLVLTNVRGCQAMLKDLKGKYPQDETIGYCLSALGEAEVQLTKERVHE